jgi:hypothetical protein
MTLPNATLIRAALRQRPAAPESPSVSSQTPTETGMYVNFSHLQGIPMHADSVILQRKDSEESGWSFVSVMYPEIPAQMDVPSGVKLRYLAVNEIGSTPGGVWPHENTGA